MSKGYFHRVAAETATRFWINNPSGEEVEKAIAAGARNVTTNPAYCSRLIEREPDYIRGVIDEVIRRTGDDNTAADQVYQGVCARILDRFSAFHRESGGGEGYVTIQADPREDDVTERIVEAAMRHQRVGSNYMAKIPVTLAGAEAIRELVAGNVPMCATEVFSVDQAVHVAELYERAVSECANRPPLYVTHITGIFDEYLQKVVRRDGVDIAPDVLSQAGCAVARKEYRILKERGYRVTMLGGGARALRHFTDFVGGDMHITINWSTAEELMSIDGPVEPLMDLETPDSVVCELTDKLPDFRRAYVEGTLPPEEFAGFGPVQLFRNMFLAGYYKLLAEVATRRTGLLA